jgi:hemerythrin-like metal-binding protein
VESIAWTSDLVTGVKDIDSQHKKIFNYLNLLVLAENNQETCEKAVKTTIEGLIEYTVIHFEEEEIALTAMGYPDLEQHKKLHREFAAKAYELKASFESGEYLLPRLITFVQEWLVKHIKQEDMKALRFKG